MIRSGYDILSDEEHDTRTYMSFIASRASNVERPHDIYYSFSMIPLYLYGHYEDAVRSGKELEVSMSQLWSIREVQLALFYLSLSMIALCREKPADADVKATIETVIRNKERIDRIGSINDVNYGMWSLLLKAELSEIQESYSDSVRSYEVRQPSQTTESLNDGK